MEKQRSYKQLKVWQKAMDLVLLVYDCTKTFPKEEMFGLSSQLRKAAVSIPSNIAEGSERRSDKDFIRFLRVASGSNAEVETQLYIAMKLGYIGTEQLFECQQLSSEIGRMVNGLINSLTEKLTGDWPLETGD